MTYAPDTSLATSLVFEQRGDEWVLSVKDPQHRKKLRRETWSPSNAKTLSKDCAASWVTGLLIRDPDDALRANEIGTASHLVMEKLYALPQPERTIERAFDILDHLDELGNPRDYVRPLPEQYDQWHDAISDNIQRVFTMEDPRTVDVVALEFKIGADPQGRRVGVPLSHPDFPKVSAPFYGIADQLRVAPDGVREVVDWKFGKFPSPRFGDEHGPQVRTYHLALDAIGFHTGRGRLLYPHPNTGDDPRRWNATTPTVNREVTFDPEDLDQALRTFVSTFQDHLDYSEANAYPTKVGPLCSWCALVSVCPAAKSAGREPSESSPRALAAAEIGITGRGLTPQSTGVQTVPMTEQQATAVYHLKHQWTTHEDVRWKSFTDSGVNPNSFLAAGLVSLSAKAASLLYSAYDAKVSATGALGIGGAESLVRPVNTVDIEALSTMLFMLAKGVEGQCNATGMPNQNPDSTGLASRVRHALFTATELTPVPYGGTSAEWQEWFTRVGTRTKVIMDAAMGCAVAPVASPWDVLGQPSS